MKRNNDDSLDSRPQILFTKPGAPLRILRSLKKTSQNKEQDETFGHHKDCEKTGPNLRCAQLRLQAARLLRSSAIALASLAASRAAKCSGVRPRDTKTREFDTKICEADLHVMALHSNPLLTGQSEDFEV